MSKEVREQFLKFAQLPVARWSANFRDLNACITRMATLSPGGRITAPVLAEEIERLKAGWSTPVAEDNHETVLVTVLSEKARDKLDLFDRAQLACVIRICRDSATLSDAGRKLFAPPGSTAKRRTMPTGFASISPGSTLIIKSSNSSPCRRDQVRDARKRRS